MRGETLLSSDMINWSCTLAAAVPSRLQTLNGMPDQGFSLRSLLHPMAETPTKKKKHKLPSKGLKIAHVNINSNNLNIPGKGLLIAHLNIWTLRNKTDELNCVMQPNNIHIMAISEMHLDHSFENTQLMGILCSGKIEINLGVVSLCMSRIIFL